MRLVLATVTAATVLSGVALAQSNAGSPAMPPNQTMSPSGASSPAVDGRPAGSPERTGSIEPGANSFTEAQARSRIEAQGFADVTDLKKDDQGIWRGRAMKNGQSMTVMLDYRGNVASQ